MTPERNYIRTLLEDLRTELHEQGLWSDEPPPAEALDSTEPFAVDQLRLEQWLQYVFIGRLEAILDHSAPLPEHCEVLPYAEQQLTHLDRPEPLLRIIGKLDIMVSRAV